MAVSFTSEMRFDAPPERVFAAMTDVDRYDDWMPGLISAERLTEGETGVGSEWRETRKILGREGSEVFEVVTCEPPRRLDLKVDGTRGSTGKGAYLFRYDIAPDGDGTHLAMTGDIDIPGFFAGLMGKMMIGTFKKMCDKDLVAMKEYVEAEQAG